MVRKQKKSIVIYIVLAISIIFLVGSSSLVNRALSRSSEKIVQPLEELSRSLDKKEEIDYQIIDAYFQNSKEQWKKHEKWWQMLIDHRESHSIASSFIRLERLLEQKDKTESQLEVAQLLYLVRHMPDSMKASLENII